jgi:tol-pal system protein YbgF
MSRFHLGLGLILAAPVWAQVEVMEPDIGAAPVYRPAPAPSAPAVAPRSTPGVGQGSGSSELFYQLQLLQDEVMKLRGVVEEQGEELRQLKQQRLDDYISLDRRIGALGGGSIAPTGGSSAQSPVDASAAPVAPPAVSRAPASADEEKSYQAAYELVRARKFAEATTGFKAFLSQYPNGSYAGNAHYWLGELYLLDGNSASAKQHFEILVNDYPDNRRLPDGMFKLGRIYHNDGDTVRAKEMLQRVVNDFPGSDSSAPRLAREYLQQNF